MPYSSFYPDEDDKEPGDPDFGYGYFADESGEKTYGHDPVEAERLYQPPPPPEPVAAEVDYLKPVGPVDEYAAMIARETGEAAPAVVPQAQTEQAQEAQPLSIDIPKSSRIAYVHNNPGNLMFAGQAGASQGEPKDGGGNWAKFETPEAGYQALKRQIDIDAGRGMSLGQFIGKYAPEFENNTKAYLRNVAGFTDAAADTPLSDIPQSELAKAMARQESSTRIEGDDDQRRPSLGAMGAPAQQQPGGMPGIPQIPGMQAAQVVSQGMPQTPDQIRAAQQRTMDSTMAQMAAVQHGAQQRVAGREEAMAQVDAQHQAMLKDASYREQINAAAKNAAKQKIDEQLRMPIAQVDPLKVIKDMDAGDWLLGGIAVLLSGIGAGFNVMAGGAPGGNSAIQAMTKAIDQSIDAQKDAIDRGERTKNNRIAHWSKVFNDAQSGEEAARAEALMATAKRIDFQVKTGVENADIKAQAMATSQQLMGQGAQLAQAIEDREAERLRVTYQPPKPVAAAPGALQAGYQGQAVLAPVGTEDKSPEARMQMANAFQPKDPLQRGQMNTLGKEMEQVAKLEKTLRSFETAYGVRPGENGVYPEEGNYDSTATGPMAGFNMAVGIPGIVDKRDRELADLWSQVELDTRMGWATEPNGETKQNELSGISKPKRDAEVAAKLTELRKEITRRTHAIMSTTVAPARAAWKFQNGYPYANADQGRQVTGRIAGP